MRYVALMGFSTVTGLFIAFIYSSPALALIISIGALLQMRRGKAWKDAIFRSVVDTLAIFSLAPVIVLTLVTPGGSFSSVELAPFADMWSTGWTTTTIYQNGGNILMFLPFGALLPLAFGRRFASIWNVLLLAAVVSVSIEVLQYVLDAGRVSATDDVIINSLGALFGAVVTRPWWCPKPEQAEPDRSDTTEEAAATKD